MERTKFEKNLNSISKRLTKMNAMVLSNLNDAMISLKNMDKDLAKKSCENDKEINAMELAVEKRCVLFITRHQPIASDLRYIQAVYKIASDFERIADISQNICDLVVEMGDEQDPLIHEKISIMAEKAQKATTDAISAFNNADLKLAGQVIKNDDKLNDMFYEVRGMLIKRLEECPKHLVSHFSYALYVIKYLEKIGDHAENIAKWVNYRHTGNLM